MKAPIYWVCICIDAIVHSACPVLRFSCLSSAWGFFCGIYTLNREDEVPATMRSVDASTCQRCDVVFSALVLAQ